MASTDVDSFVAQREGDFWVNAVIGAAIAILLSFIPFSPVLGGGVAGYLQQGTHNAGAKVGATSGLIAALPVFAVLTLVFGGIGFGALVQGSAVGTVFFVAIMLFGLLVTAAIAGGMGALGGYLGVVLAERSDDTDQYDGHVDARDPTTPADDPPVDDTDPTAEFESGTVR